MRSILRESLAQPPKGAGWAGQLHPLLQLSRKPQVFDQNDQLITPPDFPDNHFSAEPSIECSP